MNSLSKLFQIHTLSLCNKFILAWIKDIISTYGLKYEDLVLLVLPCVLKYLKLCIFIRNTAFVVTYIHGVFWYSCLFFHRAFISNICNKKNKPESCKSIPPTHRLHKGKNGHTFFFFPVNMVASVYFLNSFWF